MIVNLVGGLDNNGNCEVGLFEVNGMPLRSQVATAMYEIYIRQEWARANDLTGSIKLLEYLMGTTTDRTLVDSGEGTYVWDYSQDACPDTLVSLYKGRIKVPAADYGSNPKTKIFYDKICKRSDSSNMKFFNFFPLLGANFALRIPYPDPQTQQNPDLIS